MNADNEVLSKPILFGKYCLLERISVGGMAEVFKAKQFGVEGFERLLAVKRILDSIAEDEVFIKMFIDEAKIAGQLNHPNIAQIFDLGRVEGSYFIALEYVSGKDLRTLWERMVSLGEHGDVFMACHMVMKVCEALQYAHDKRDAAGNELNIVHRDISPQNILISYEGDVKIIDFGIAKAQGKSSQTQVGILKGKFSYMSPEQVRGLHVDHRADIFSLGIVLYELLTVTRLFLGESDFDTLEKIRKVEMSPPTLYNPHIPRELEDIVLKSLAKSPDERYQSGSELHDALEQFLRNQSSYFGTKDLATYMKGAFVAEIELERKKLDYYRTINIETMGGDIQSESSTAPSVDIWEEETSLFGRGRNFNEISPAAELQIGEPGFGGAGPQPSEMRMTAGAPEIFPEPPPQVPGVDINKPIDDEDDPTIEWDRFNLEELGGAGMSQGAGEEKEPVVAAPPPSVDKARPSLEGPRSVPAVRYTSQPPSIVPAPASSGSSAGLVLALLFFIFALVLGGIMAAIYAPQFAAAKKADLKFKISGAESVEIVIDGDKVHSGPLEQGYVLLEDFEAGRREITIRAEGREAVSDSLLVQGGKSYEIPVELRKEAATKAVTVGIKVKVEPGDAQVLLDDKPLDAAKPLVATGLKPGKHKLVFRKEGFVEQVQEFTLEEGTRDFEVTLKPARITLEITAEPVGAKVSLHALDGGKRALVKKGKAPFAVKDLDATRKYEIKVSRDGFADWIKPFEPGLKATETFAVKLEAKTEPVALVGEKKPVVDKEAERKRLEMAEKRRAEKERRELLAEKTKPEVRERPEQAKGSGFVAIISKPPARVILNGRDIGYTPKLKVSLPAGKHRAVLKMESIKVTKSYSFTIKPNSTHIIKGRP